jgi:two-component system, OmpR family, phosphate regulon response regulator PhoB
MSTPGTVTELRPRAPVGAHAIETATNVPIVTITARAGEAERVLRELSLQIQTLLQPPRASHESSTMGELHIDMATRRVTVAGKETPLTDVEFKLLGVLLERRELVVGRGVLLAEVWQYSPQTKTRTVDIHVKRLRDKLGVAGRHIQTVRGSGYRLSENSLGEWTPRHRSVAQPNE